MAPKSQEVVYQSKCLRFAMERKKVQDNYLTDEMEINLKYIMNTPALKKEKLWNWSNVNRYNFTLKLIRNYNNIQTV